MRIGRENWIREIKIFGESLNGGVHLQGVKFNNTDSQKADVAVDMLPWLEKEAKRRERLSLGRGEKGKAKEPHLLRGQSRDHAGKLFGISGRIVFDAKMIRERSP